MTRPRLFPTFPPGGPWRPRSAFRRFPEWLAQLLLLCAGLLAGADAADSTSSGTNFTSASIAALLQPIRERHNVPAVAGALFPAGD